MCQSSNEVDNGAKIRVKRKSTLTAYIIRREHHRGESNLVGHVIRKSIILSITVSSRGLKSSETFNFIRSPFKLVRVLHHLYY